MEAFYSLLYSSNAAFQGFRDNICSFVSSQSFRENICSFVSSSLSLRHRTLLMMFVLPICTFEFIIINIPASFASLENITCTAPSTLMGFLHYWILLWLCPISKNWSDSIGNTTTQELTVSDSYWEEEGAMECSIK